MIVPMKKAEIVVLKEDRNSLLKSLQRYGEFMIITEDENRETPITNPLLQKTDKYLKLLKKYKDKPSFVREIKEVDYHDFVSIDESKHNLIQRIEDIDEEIKTLESQNTSLKQSIEFFKPWQELEFVPNLAKSLKYAVVRIGYIEPRNVEKFKKISENFGSIISFYGVSQDNGQTIVVSSFIEDDQVIYDEMKMFGFNEINLETNGLLVNKLIDDKSNLLSSNLSRIKELHDEIRTFSQSSGELEVLSDQISSFDEINNASFVKTLETTYLVGWIRSDRIERFEKSVNEATDIYDIAITDPKDDETPPTVIKNNKFIRPFETITDMFSMPSKDDVDPNPVMSFWYWITFGLMMGDAGYGLVMLILFYILLKAKKPKGDGEKLFKVLFLSGFTTILWGVLFGSYFGATFMPILFIPMKEPLKMLIFSLVFGASQIICAILVAAYKNYKKKQYMDILYDQVSWILLIVGLGFLVLPALSKIGMIMALIGAGLILLMAGRSKKNIFGRIGGGFGSLYGITGYMSDILSYSRLLALGLSTAVVSMVMNMMAAMIQGSPIGFIFSLFVYIIGHAFNIAMGLLSAYVHDSRLQYIEFFGKFYEGGGYAFKPLSFKLNYVDKVNDK